MSNDLEELQETVLALLAKVDSLTRKVDLLTKENNHLKKRLSKYETPKNSNNSSIPPSKDENRPKRKSLREPSGLKPGGQKGRKGNTLKMVDNPDITKNHAPNY